MRVLVHIYFIFPWTTSKYSSADFFLEAFVFPWRCLVSSFALLVSPPRLLSYLPPSSLSSVDWSLCRSVLMLLPVTCNHLLSRSLQFWNTANGSMLNSVDTGSQVSEL